MPLIPKLKLPEPVLVAVKLPLIVVSLPPREIEEEEAWPVQFQVKLPKDWAKLVKYPVGLPVVEL